MESNFGYSRMNCALCLQKKPLRNSHIISEFLYESLYDNKNRFHMLSNVPGQRNEILQKGLREKLLCDDCEQKLGKHEDYASRVLAGRSQIRPKTSGAVTLLEGFDYTAFKLFQMSTLWRCGVSRQAAFKQVNLGAHSERLRQMLLADDPGEPWRYGSLLFTVHLDGEKIDDLMVEPSWSKLDSHRVYRFVFGGMVWITFASSHAPNRFISENFLQRDGTYRMRAQKIKEMTFLMNSIEKIKEHGKFGSEYWRL